MLLWSGYIFARPCPNLKRRLWLFYSLDIWWVVAWTRFWLLLLALRMVQIISSHRVARQLLSDEVLCTVVSWSWNIESSILLAVWCTEAEFRSSVQSHFFLLLIVSWTWRDGLASYSSNISTLPCAKFCWGNIITFYWLMCAWSWDEIALLETKIFELAPHPMRRRLGDKLKIVCLVVPNIIFG